MKNDDFKLLKGFGDGRTDEQTFVIVESLSRLKIAQKETLVHSHFTPSLLSLNGTRGIGTQKIVY